MRVSMSIASHRWGLAIVWDKIGLESETIYRALSINNDGASHFDHAHMYVGGYDALADVRPLVMHMNT